MNVILAGDGAIAALSYRALSALDGVTVSAALFTGDGDLPAYVENDGIPSATLTTLRHTSAAIPFLAGADLLVMANVPFIVPKAVLDTPRFGTLCFHPSLLPRHRGIDAVKWTLEMGDTETGSTVFLADGGMDTGPIIWQRSCPVPAGISPGGLYYRHLVPLGVEGIVASVADIRDGIAVFTEQDETRATYEPPFATPALHKAAD